LQLNSCLLVVDVEYMKLLGETSVSIAAAPELHPGTILVSAAGDIKILRSRNKLENGWNCADGAGIDDSDAQNTGLWTGYTPERLAAYLAMATELHGLAGTRELSGGLATWDACSGRLCVLPRLAKIVR
jgi:hypothetical protein